jgi:prevent-host-death family protein
VRKVSIRDLHSRTSELVKEAERGETIVVERRGKAVAELGPISATQGTGRIPDMRAFWKSMPKLSVDSGRILEEDR